MDVKHSMREMVLSSSFNEEAPQVTQIDRCPILIGKNVDLTSFTFDAPSFHIEDLFVSMGWVSIIMLNDKVYPSIVKDFYKKMTFSPGTGITCLVRNKRIKITQELIRSNLHLEDGGIRLYTTKTISHLEEYNPIEACRRVTQKHFETPVRLSTNQLTLTCCVLHNIIAHIIVPRKSHLDEVKHYDVFLLDSILIGRKLYFSYIVLQHMNSVLSGTRHKALRNDTHEVSFQDGQWVAKSKGFDDESRPSTLPFESGEEMDKDEDDPPPRLRSHRPFSSTSDFTFTEDHYNILNGRFDSFTSTVEGLRNSMNTLQESVAGMTTLLQDLHSRLDTVLLPHPPPEN
ncbi:Uncharacterized protein Adt_46552 [Abeliophyllum distichum]|uniref:Putative plant transposon protein domain-containing protein n=1 Tax=Abeliophyllum distichum TaxID=126358 RepID=A0ABD1P0W0_9LAMI